MPIHVDITRMAVVRAQITSAPIGLAGRMVITPESALLFGVFLGLKPQRLAIASHRHHEGLRPFSRMRCIFRRKRLTQP